MSVPLDELTANPYAPPHEAVPRTQARVDPAALAGRGRRLLAVLLDSALAGVPIFYIVSIGEAEAPTETQLLLAGLLLLTLGLLFVVQCTLLHFRGQTLGKMVSQVRIVRADGSRAGLRRILFLRFGVMMALRFLPYAGNAIPVWDSLMIFRKDRRCAHDLVADTVVVTTRAPALDPPTPAPSPLPTESAALEPSAS